MMLRYASCSTPAGKSVFAVFISFPLVPGRLSYPPGPSLGSVDRNLLVGFQCLGYGYTGVPNLVHVVGIMRYQAKQNKYQVTCQQRFPITLNLWLRMEIFRL